MNILVLLAAISMAVYGESCKNISDQYSDKITVCESSEACHYIARFASESDSLKKLVSPHGNDENYMLKADVSLNLT